MRSIIYQASVLRWKPDELNHYYIKYLYLHIFYIEVDGFTLIHAGDLGQKALTEEQRLAVKQGVDICVMQLDNPLSNLNANNKRAFSLIEEMNPNYVIISHLGERNFEYVNENYIVWSGTSKPIEIKKKENSSEPEFLILGEVAEEYQAIYNLRIWSN